MSVTLDTLDRLVAFDTVSASANAPIIDYIEAFLAARGAHCVPLPSKEDGKLGLYAEIGPKDVGGILLSAHTDVVPVAGQSWTRAPFSLTREGDRVFGRGTTDMKGFVGSMLYAADLASRSDLKKPLKLLFSYDEEIGCVGIQEMLPHLPNLIGRPRAVIVGEPTEMQVAIGHKGKSALTAQCRGQAGHSALAPHFVNALHLATDLVAGLRQMQDWLAEHGARDDAYDIPHSTVHVGRLTGGTALNIVPDRATVAFEFRHLKADAPDMLLTRIRQLAQSVAARYRPAFTGATVELEQVNSYPGLDVAPASDAVTLAQRLLQTGQTTKVAFGTEAGFFDAMGIPTIVCGPGSMADQGHKPDEFISLEQLAICDRMMAGIVQELSV